MKKLTLALFFAAFTSAFWLPVPAYAQWVIDGPIIYQEDTDNTYKIQPAAGYGAADYTADPSSMHMNSSANAYLDISHRSDSSSAYLRGTYSQSYRWADTELTPPDLTVSYSGHVTGAYTASDSGAYGVFATSGTFNISGSVSNAYTYPGVPHQTSYDNARNGDIIAPQSSGNPQRFFTIAIGMNTSSTGQLSIMNSFLSEAFFDAHSDAASTLTNPR